MPILHIVLITVALEYVLKSGHKDFPYLFLFLFLENYFGHL